MHRSKVKGSCTTFGVYENTFHIVLHNSGGHFGLIL